MRLRILVLISIFLSLIPTIASASFNGIPDFTNPRILGISSKESVGNGTWVNGSGFLYSPRIVLTAGHFKTFNPEAPLYVSPPNQEFVKGMRTVKVIKRMFSPTYNDKTYTDDFAIFILEKPLISINEAPLITPELLSNAIESGAPMKVMGFGVYEDVCAGTGQTSHCTSDWLNKSTVPRSIEMTPVKNSRYQNHPLYNAEVATQLFLTTSGKNGPCAGDSGGSTTVRINGVDYYVGTGPSGFWSGYSCGSGELSDFETIGYTAPVYRFLDFIAEAEKYVAEHPFIEPSPTPTPSVSPTAGFTQPRTDYQYLTELARSWAKASNASDTGRKQCKSARDSGFIYKKGKKISLGQTAPLIRRDLNTKGGFQACLNGFK